MPEAVCLCQLASIPIRSRVLVLVHHIEAFKTTNTGRLAKLALGADFERWGLPDRPLPTLPDGPLLLLFPFDEARELCAADAQSGATLVVPDGNWPQARKIARRVGAHPLVTRVKLADHESHYGLRRTERTNALSTFESIAHALAILEGQRGPEVARECLSMFDAFVARHTTFTAGPQRSNEP